MPYRYGYYFDPTYLLVIIGALVSLACKIHVQQIFRHAQQEQYDRCPGCTARLKQCGHL